MLVKSPVSGGAFLLSRMSAERRETFELRVTRWWPVLRAALAERFPDTEAGTLERYLLGLAAAAYVGRDRALHRLDQQRAIDPDWFQRPRMLGYAAYVEQFAGSLADVAGQLPYLGELGVTHLQLMPVQPDPQYAAGSRAVTVREDLGSLDDLRGLADELRGANMSLGLDVAAPLDPSDPDAFVELAELVLSLAAAGVDVLRVAGDVPAGALRALVRVACPAVLLAADGATAAGEVDLVGHDALAVHIWSSLAARDARLAVHALRRLPVLPATASWTTRLRDADAIDWAIRDADAAAAGLSGPAHRAFLQAFYTGRFPGSFAAGLPADGDRVSGTTASLAGLTAAVESGDPTAVDGAIDRVLLAHAVTFGWGGMPMLWSGDELGLPSDPRWAYQPGHEADNRWAHRPRIGAAARASRLEPHSVPGRVFAGLRRLAAARARLPQLHASVAAGVLEPADPGVLAVLRRHPAGPLLELFNVTDSPRHWPAGQLAELGLVSVCDALDPDADPLAPGARAVRLAPYQARWLLPS